MNTFNVAILLVAVVTLAYGAEDFASIKAGFEEKAAAIQAQVEKAVAAIQGTPEDKEAAANFLTFTTAAINGMKDRLDTENAEEQAKFAQYWEGFSENLKQFLEWAQDKSF